MNRREDNPERIPRISGWRRLVAVMAGFALLAGGAAFWWLSGGPMSFGLGVSQGVYAEYMPFLDYTPVQYSVITSPYHQDLAEPPSPVILRDRNSLQNYMAIYGIQEVLEQSDGNTAASLLDTADFTRQAVIVITDYHNPGHRLLSPIVSLSQMHGCMTIEEITSIIIVSRAEPSHHTSTPETELQGYLLAVDRGLLNALVGRWNGQKIVTSHESYYFDFTAALADEYEQENGEPHPMRYDNLTTEAIAEAGYRVYQYTHPDSMGYHAYLVPEEGVAIPLNQSYYRLGSGIGDMHTDGRNLIYSFSETEECSFIGVAPLDNPLAAQESRRFYCGNLRLERHWSGRWGVYGDINGEDKLLAWISIKPEGVQYEYMDEELCAIPMPEASPTPYADVLLATPTPLPNGDLPEMPAYVLPTPTFEPAP